MEQAFKFTFRILKNTKGFLSSMLIMPIFMIMLVSITLAYSDIPVVGYIGEKAPKIDNVKMLKLDENEKDYFLGLSQGTLVVKTDSTGKILSYYSSIKSNPLVNLLENANNLNNIYIERPKLSYSVGIILFKLLTSAGLLASILIYEKNNGILLRVRNTKTTLSKYILGKSLAIIFVYEIANICMVLFYKLAGFDLGKSSFLQILIVFTFTLFISSGLYIYFAAKLNNEGYIWTISTAVFLPLGLFSGILFPVEYMADWMKVIAHISPLYYLRNALITGQINFIAFGIMLVVSSAFALIGINQLKKRT